MVLRLKRTKENKNFGVVNKVTFSTYFPIEIWTFIVGSLRAYTALTNPTCSISDSVLAFEVIRNQMFSDTIQSK